MTATWKNRPTCKPPADPVHEFLANSMSTGDPIFVTWLNHLEWNGTPYTVKQNGKNKAMLYGHRIVGGEFEGWWCCDAQRPTIRIGKNRRKF